MSLHTERRVVVHAGRRFVVTAPTVQTVLTAVRVFASEMVVLRKEYLKEPLTPDVWIEVSAKMLTAKGKAASEVLGTCCALWQGAPGDLEELAGADISLRDALARAMLSICDPAAIMANMSWDDIDDAISGTPAEPEAAPADDGPTALDILVTTVALAFHQPPGAVMGWPYEAVTALFDSIIPACHAREREAPAQSAKLAEYGVH